MDPESEIETDVTRLLSIGEKMLPRNRSIPDCVVIPELGYADVGEAVTWLCDRFGLVERLRIGNHRAQLVFNGGAIVVTERRSPGAAGTSSLMVRVGEIDRHHARAVQRGVRILRPPADYPYGERQYTAEDLGGHTWTFTQTIADSDPASWGGVLKTDL
jgi:uncharacterized glyoxalase superfamily protein PhnB